MRKVELSLKEKEKYEIIKKLVETNGNKERARIKLKLKSIRQVNRLIAGYKEYGKEFFVYNGSATTTGWVTTYLDSLKGTFDIRPVINLNSNIEIIDGNGTLSNPYVIKTN